MYMVYSTWLKSAHVGAVDFSRSWSFTYHGDHHGRVIGPEALDQACPYITSQCHQKQRKNEEEDRYSGKTTGFGIHGDPLFTREGVQFSGLWDSRAKGGTQRGELIILQNTSAKAGQTKNQSKIAKKLPHPITPSRSLADR